MRFMMTGCDGALFLKVVHYVLSPHAIYGMSIQHMTPYIMWLSSHELSQFLLVFLNTISQLAIDDYKTKTHSYFWIIGKLSLSKIYRYENYIS